MKKRIIRAALALPVCLCLFGCAAKEAAEPGKTRAVAFDEEAMARYGHTERVFDYMANNVTDYRNGDGTQTLYVYSAPVEPCAALTEEGDSLSCTGDYFMKTLPLTLSDDDGIAVTGPDVHAIVYPAAAGNYPGARETAANAFGQPREGVRYADVFGKGTDLVCSPTTFGVNLEIVLDRKPETNRWQLRLQLPELVPDTGSPDYILFKTALEDGVVKSILYTPLAADRGGRWSYANSVRLVDKDREQGIYTVEYTIDEAFLTDRDTEYPVRLNQSVHLYTPKQPDTSAYSQTGDEAGHYLSPYMLLGDSTIKGEGYTFVRYETLAGLGIDPDKVVSATYRVRNLFAPAQPVTIGAYAVTADWCSINTRWFNRPPFDDAPVGTAKVDGAGDVAIDITPLLKEMLRDPDAVNAPYSVNNSFLIRCDTPGANLLFASGDNGLFSPGLEIVLAE